MRFMYRPVCLAAVLPLLVGAGAAHASSTKIVETTGDVSVKAPGEGRSPAIADMDLLPGSVVRTGKDGEVELLLGEGRQLKLRPGSSIRISPRKRRKKRRSVALFFGRLWSRVTSFTGARTYDVVTHNATAGVRGTDFETWVGADGNGKVKVTQGQVGVDGIEQADLIAYDSGKAACGDYLRSAAKLLVKPSNHSLY